MQKINIGKIKKLDYSLAEAYKSLRTNIEFCGSDVKVIGITSCIPNEGKSSIALNLSQSMVDADKKVLLVDADLRKSVMMGRYRISKAANGLSHYLSGFRSLNDVLCETNIDNLYMLLSGPVPPNPSELLSSNKFIDFINQVKDKFDYVIVDTPPLGSVIDSAIVSRVCDGMMLVMSSNEISYKFAQKVKAQLEKTECRILGVILNKVKIGQKGYYGKYYGRYYGRYYGKYYGKYGD